jgi:hypothetical protein
MNVEHKKYQKEILNINRDMSKHLGTNLKVLSAAKSGQLRQEKPTAIHRSMNH